jgi:hypothetical protein
MHLNIEILRVLYMIPTNLYVVSQVNCFIFFNLIDI